MIKVVSFDIFQTLVDVNKRIVDIWKKVFGDAYSYEKAVVGSRAIIDSYPEVYNDIIKGNSFNNMEEVYFKCAKIAQSKIPFFVEPKKVVYHLLYQHSLAPFYDETLSVMKKIEQSYTIILASDSSHLMVDRLLSDISYSEAFLSDDLQIYKGDKDGKFFKYIVNKLKLRSDEIIHVGDSKADIEGAYQAGVVSCWLNRDNKKLNSNIQPNYVINSLEQLLEILGLV